MVRNSSVKWAPAMHRFGQKFDHAMLSATWRWRTKKTDKFELPDYQAMDSQSWDRFDSHLRIKNQESAHATGEIPVHNGHTQSSVTEVQPDSSQEYRKLFLDVTETIKAVVPKKQKRQRKGRVVSAETKELFKKRTQEYSKKAPTKGERRNWNKKITRACRKDWRTWVTGWTQEIERANNVGDTKAIYRGVKAISGGKQTFATKQPTQNADGSRIQSPTELANVWSKFLAEKFQPTDLERQRDEFEALPEATGEEAELTRAEFEEAVKCMKNGKAAGIDTIPAEVWKNSKEAKNRLYEFLSKIWRKEKVPPELAVTVFVMIFKNKGSPDDCTKYRCIGLLNHAYKIMTVVLLKRLVAECQAFFSDWQAGFRTKRGCRDNILLLRVLYEQVINSNSKCVVTFIDFKAAFDSVSHKFIDATLARAGASRKTRAIFRAIYKVASGVARVNGINGKRIYSDAFDIGRGVVQGDIISPVLFILALDQLVQAYDTHGGTGVQCGEIFNLRVLGYADDAALIEPAVEDMTKRITALTDAEADMHVSTSKTFSQHVYRREDVLVTAAEVSVAEEKFVFKCGYCDRKFKDMRAKISMK